MFKRVKRRRQRQRQKQLGRDLFSKLTLIIVKRMKRHRSLIFTDLTVHMIIVLLLLFPADDHDAKVTKHKQEKSARKKWYLIWKRLWPHSENLTQIRRVVLDDQIRFRWQRQAKEVDYEVLICQVRSVHGVALNMLRGHLQNIGFPQQLGLQKVVFMLWTFNKPQEDPIQFNSATSLCLHSTRRLRLSFYDEAFQLFNLSLSGCLVRVRLARTDRFKKPSSEWGSWDYDDADGIS